MCDNMSSLNFNLIEKRYGEKFIEHVVFARNLAFVIDQDPLNIKQFSEANTIHALCQTQGMSCYEKTIWTEAVSYGDAGVYLSCPGPSLAGTAIEQMANKAQQDIFFDYIIQNKCTSFAVITEPKHGSDVANIQTLFTKINDDYFAINGEKCFITHGYDGKMAMVLGRTGPGAFDIVGALVTNEDLENGAKQGTIQRELLPIIGLKGTCLAKIQFNDFLVPVTNLLGQNLRLMQRGMLTVIKTFNLMRPCVAGFVLGQTQAMLDYVLFSLDLEKSSTYAQQLYESINALNAELYQARNALYIAANKVDANPLEYAFISLIKAKITNLAEKVCSFILDDLDASFYFEHPLLMKWIRDCYAFEYMEGTTIMQKRNVYQKYLRQKQIL